MIAAGDAVLVVGGVCERLYEVGALLEAIIERLLELRKLELLPHVVELLNGVVGEVEKGVGQLEGAAFFRLDVQSEPCHKL